MIAAVGVEGKKSFVGGAHGRVVSDKSAVLMRADFFGGAPGDGGGSNH